MKTFMIITCFIALSVCLTSCRKDKTNALTEDFTKDVEMLVQNNLTAQDLLLASGEKAFPEYFSSDEVILSDFLLDETYQDENGRFIYEELDPVKKNISEKSILRCLKKLNLEERQLKAVRNELKEYGKCKAPALERLKSLIQQLNKRYREKYHHLAVAYEAGSISREKFEALLKELKISYHKELHELYNNEKLRDVLAQCFRDLLHDLNTILNERQWKAFMGCMREG